MTEPHEHRRATWQPIETAPDEPPHVRGLWVYHSDGRPPFWYCTVGYVSHCADEGWRVFVNLDGEACGWRPEDFTHWLPLPEYPTSEEEERKSEHEDADGFPAKPQQTRRNMTMTDIEYDMTRAVVLLDAALPALVAAAEREARREAGKALRCITEQERAKAARELIAELTAKYGIDLGYADD